MRSTWLLESVESQTIDCELIFGREPLLRTISSVPHDVILDHVRYYRQIIRTNPWPNIRLESSFSVFLEDYYRAAVAYIETAFELLHSFPWTDSSAFKSQYEKALASEALRGQFGKRSETGLDARLEAGLLEIENLFCGAIPGDIVNETIQVLCSPTTPSLSAEAALLKDFVELRAIVPRKPCIEQVVSLNNDSEEIAWRFLRRHCRWSIEQMAFYYDQFESPIFGSSVLSAEKARAAQADKRRRTILKLAETVSPAVFAQVMKVAQELTMLNHINLALEPSFSFKGGPGLLHGMAFRHGSRLGLQGSIPQADISALKWQLLKQKDP